MRRFSVSLCAAAAPQEAWAAALRLLLGEAEKTTAAASDAKSGQETETLLTTTKTTTTSSLLSSSSLPAEEVAAVKGLGNEAGVRRSSTATEVSPQTEACASLLWCCVRHDAPLHVCRAAYATLRIQCKSKDIAAARHFGQWHSAYARTLLQKSASRDAKCEALRVLLLDAPADGVAVRKAGLLLALDILRAVSDDKYKSFSIPREKPHSHTQEKPISLPTVNHAAGTASDVDPVGNALWDTLCRDVNKYAVVSADICRAILTDPSASANDRQKAIYSFATIADILPHTPADHSGPEHVIVTTHVVPFLNALHGLLSDHRFSRELAFAMSTPRRNATRDARFLAVSLISGIMRHMRILHTNTLHVLGRVDAASSSDTMELWRTGSAAALRALRRILLILPPSRKAARQKAFCSAFRGILDGVFFTRTASSAVNAKEGEEMDVMAMIAQMYGERDWHEPSVGMYMECLSAWRRFSEMRQVFEHLYRRDTKNWRLYCQMQEIKETGASAHKVAWSTSISLPTCRCVVHAACEAEDPAMGAMAIKQMLRCLLVAKNEQDEKEEGALDLNGESLSQWTQRVREEMIPMVDKVFCKTGQDTEQNWLRGDYSNYVSQKT